MTAQITDPAVIATSVNLLYAAAGTAPSTILGTLHDDGITGDALAGDNVYSLQFNLPSGATSATEIDFQVSAAFRGTLLRTKSTLIAVSVKPAASTSTWQTLSDADHLFSISFPPSWNLQIVEHPNYEGEVKMCDFVLPDGSVAFTVDVFTTAEWQDLISSSYGITPLLIGTSTGYAFALEEPQDIENSPGITADEKLQTMPAIYSTFKPNK